MHVKDEGAARQRGFAVLICRERDRALDILEAKRFRHTELVEHLGWDLRSIDGVEQDEFDNDDAVHCLIRSQGELVGYFRAIRGDRPYLAETKFPALATLKPYPKHALAWEISRITVRRSDRRFEAALHVYSTMIWFGRQHGALSLCGFVDLNHERLFARAGLVTERYGEPATIGSDRFGRPITVVAGEIPLPRQSGVRFERLASLADRMEIEDALAILGRSRVSA